MEFFKLRSSTCNGEKVTIGDRQKAGVTENFQSPEMAEVDRLKRLQIDLIAIVGGLLGSRVDREELQRPERVAVADEQDPPCFRVHMADSSPRDGCGDQINTMLKTVENKSVSLGSAKPMKPDALDSGRYAGVPIKNSDSVLERRKWVAVDSSTRWSINQLVQSVALATVRELGPPLYFN
jgi:hypothetical protein